MRGFKPRLAPPQPDQTPAGIRTYNELRRRILHGELTPGTVMTEAHTASLLGVSRTPVREAMRDLLNEGLLEEGPRRQILVARLLPDIDREVRLLRSVLEPLACREAARRCDEPAVDQMRLIMIRTRRAIAAGNVHAFRDCDDELHLHIARISGPHLLHDAIRRLRGLARLGQIDQPTSDRDLRRFADEHDAIIDALESADPDAAERAMTAHLRAVGARAPRSAHYHASAN
jgi:DNA-binding GntR family transcriptional regulator